MGPHLAGLVTAPDWFDKFVLIKARELGFGDTRPRPWARIELRVTSEVSAGWRPAGAQAREARTRRESIPPHNRQLIVHYNQNIKLTISCGS